MESDIPHLFVFSAVPDDKHYLARPEATGLPENSEGSGRLHRRRLCLFPFCPPAGRALFPATRVTGQNFSTPCDRRRNGRNEKTYFFSEFHFSITRQGRIMSSGEFRWINRPSGKGPEARSFSRQERDRRETAAQKRTGAEDDFLADRSGNLFHRGTHSDRADAGEGVRGRPRDAARSS